MAVLYLLSLILAFASRYNVPLSGYERDVGKRTTVQWLMGVYTDQKKYVAEWQTVSQHSLIWVGWTRICRYGPTADTNTPSSYYAFLKQKPTDLLLGGKTVLTMGKHRNYQWP